MGKAPLWGTPHPLSLAAAAAKHSPCLQPTPSCLSKNCDRGGSHKGCSQAQGAPSPLPAAPDSRRVHSLAVATSPPKQPLSWAPAPGGSALQAGPGNVDMQECAAFQAFELEEGEACPTPPGGGAPAVPSGSEPLSRSIPSWALPGVHWLARDGSSISACSVGPQSSSVEMWKVASFPASPGLPPSLPVNVLSPQGPKAVGLAHADPFLLACRSSACEHSIKAAPIVKRQGVRAPWLQRPQKCLLSFPRIPHHPRCCYVVADPPRL